MCGCIACCILHQKSHVVVYSIFFFQAEDGIRDHCVTGVQTCALPILIGTSVERMVGNCRSTLVPIRMSSERGGGSSSDLRRSEERRVGKECRSRRSQDH